METNTAPSMAPAVAAEVRAGIARAGVRQKAVAAHLGMSQGALSRRITGASPFTLDELARVAGFLGVPLTALLPSTDERVAS